MDWPALLVALLGGGVLGTVIAALFHYLETRHTTKIAAARVKMETQELDIETEKVRVSERQADGAVAEQVAAAFTQLVKELREQLDDLKATMVEQERVCHAKIDEQTKEIERLREEVARLHAELYRRREDPRGV